jgi:sarcosine/dimethylglycine N-methyltransferase
VFWEVARVLKPEGRFIFTDPMQIDDCPKGVLDKVLARIHLEELGSVKKYKRLANKADLEQVFIKQLPDQLVNHYTAVLAELKNRYDEMLKKSSQSYLDDMMIGLQHWIEAGKEGYLNWGILQFQKRNI